MSRPVDAVDALVVGAGPAGLAAAAALRAAGTLRVVVVDREDEAGGTPRLCEHTGFGVRDLRRVLGGPAYARRWAARAAAAGAEIRVRTMVTGWAGPRRLEVTGPDGVLEIEAGVVVLATGARERPRAARLVPGTRPAGVFTTGQLQHWVHRHHLPVGDRALVVGAEHVSYSAALTLRRAGVRPVALVTELPRTQTSPPVDRAARLALRLPVWTGTTVVRIEGRPRVRSVVLRGPDGTERDVPVDTVVFSGEFVPDGELARLGGLLVDPGTRGPALTAGGASSSSGIFVAGNLAHPAEPADAAAARAGAVGRAAAGWLRAGGAPAGAVVRVRVADPLRWVAPNLVVPGAEVDRPLLLRSSCFVDGQRLDVLQGERRLASYRLRRLVPNRSHPLPSGWCRHVGPGEDVRLVLS